jgi:tetratricopeptide (TPR) repeat protein
MKKRDSLGIITLPRAILYTTGLAICGVLLYIYLVITPRIARDKAEVFYIDKNFVGCFEHCENALIQLPREATLHLLMGKACDGLAEDLENARTLYKEGREKAGHPFYGTEQQKYFRQQINMISQYLYEWQGEDLTKKALSSYQKAYEFSPTWNTGIKIVEAHIQAKRVKEASELLSRLSAPITPSEAFYQAFLQTELYAQPAAQGQADNETLARQCHVAIELYKKLAEDRKKESMTAFQLAQVYLHLAHIAEQKSDLKEARQHCEKVAGLSPNDPKTYLAWAKILHKDKAYSEEQDILAKAVDLAPQDIETQFELACLAITLWDQSGAMQTLEQALFFQKGEYGTAFYDRVKNSILFERCRHEPNFQLLMGWFYAAPVETQQNLREAIHATSRNNFDHAMDCCQKVVKVDPKNYTAYLVWLYSLLGQKSHKIAWEKHILEIRTRLAEPKLRLPEKTRLEREIAKAQMYMKSQSVLQFDLKQCEEKIAELLGQLRQLTSDPVTELSIANSYLCFHFYQEAKEAAKPLIEKIADPGLQAVAHFILGYSNWKLKQAAEAEIHFGKAQELAPQIPNYSILRARALADLEKPNEAAAEYLKALQITKEIPSHRYEAGRFFLSLKKYPEAREQFQACVTLNPSMYLGWYQMAKAFLLEGNQADALKMLEESFKNKGNVEVLNRMLHTDTEWKAVYTNPEFRRILITYPYE